MKRLVTLSLAMLMLFLSSYTSEAYSEIDSWFEAEFEQALNEYKIIPEDFENKVLKEDISRGEFSLILMKAYESLGHSLPEELESPAFTDTNVSYINMAYQLGFISGYKDGTFKENNPIKRQEIFTMLFNFSKVVRKDDALDEASYSQILEGFNDGDSISQWAKEATAMMKYYGVVNGSSEEMIKPLDNTSRIESIVLVTRMLNISKATKVKVGKAVSAANNETADKTTTLASKEKLTSINKEEAVAKTQVKATVTPKIDFSKAIYKVGYNSSKNSYVFGTGSEYTSGDQAEQYMVNVTVDVWMIDTYGNKYPTTRTIKVNTAIAKMVKAVFADIFAGDEKFPIKSVSGYAWRANSTSEHRLGLAIDINPTENYMIRSSGSIVAGSYWKPGDDPYSIKEDGDVVKAFAKYGFAWGGNAWRSANDYMHFSYFGN